MTVYKTSLSNEIPVQHGYNLEADDIISYHALAHQQYAKVIDTNITKAIKKLQNQS